MEDCVDCPAGDQIIPAQQFRTQSVLFKDGVFFLREAEDFSGSSFDFVFKYFIDDQNAGLLADSARENRKFAFVTEENSDSFGFDIVLNIRY